MANTIPALKRSFLSSQARVLNTPLEVPEDWRQETAASEDRELSDVAIEEVLRKGQLTVAIISMQPLLPSARAHSYRANATSTLGFTWIRIGHSTVIKYSSASIIYYFNLNTLIIYTDVLSHYD